MRREEGEEELCGEDKVRSKKERRVSLGPWYRGWVSCNY